MADMPNSFWSGWIAVITVVSLAAMVWMVVSIYFSKSPDPTQHEPGTEPVWDRDLREGNKAPPLWWFWLLFGALIFSVIYLMLYPGMGSYRGALNWSQDSRLQGSYENFTESFAAVRANITQSTLTELQNESDLMETAARLFDRNCAACHGIDGRGQASLFPNLMDVDWQWGSSAENIEQTIRLGRTAMMPPWQAVLGDEGVDEVAGFILALNTDTAAEHPGKVRYDQMCIACHGPDGSGNPLLGAPNLHDESWL
ncbi:MAG: c-type cytochrome, partial [Pseudohongiellaceae bacterium]